MLFSESRYDSQGACGPIVGIEDYPQQAAGNLPRKEF